MARPGNVTTHQAVSTYCLASASINNDGDTEAWPVWTITRPGVDPAIRNVTTGGVTEILTTVAVGETVVIDTRPDQKVVSTGYGSRLTPTPNSSLWAFARGVNAIQVELNAATAASSVQLSYKRQYWGP